MLVGESKVFTKPGPIVGTHQVIIRAVYNIHIPAHQAHLEAQDGGVIAIVRYNVSDSMAVGNPSKACAPDHVAAFID